MLAKEENGNYICLKHNQFVTLVAMDSRLFSGNSMFCNMCMIENRSPLNQILSVEQAKEMLREQSQQTTEQEKIITQQIEKLEQSNKTMIELRSSLLQNFDTIIRNINQWIQDLKSQVKQENIDYLQWLQQSSYIQQVSHKPYLSKIEKAFQKLSKLDDIDKYYQQIRNINEQSIEEQQQYQSDQFKDKNDLITYKMVNSFNQQDDSNAIAFNQTGSIMIAGSGQNIKVYQFESGSITFITELVVQGYSITCLLFSKKHEWFISADGLQSSGNLKCWKQVKNNNTLWQCNQAMQKHKGGIRCIILNKNENQLISGSEDMQIIVWTANSTINRIDFQYSLEHKHTNSINGLSYNASETLLISCGRDKQLILWAKGKNDRWVFLNNVRLSNHLSRVSFIGETSLLVQQIGVGYSNAFEVVNNELEQQKSLKLTHNYHKENDDYYLFPIIYNQSKGIIIVKQHKQVYLIKKELNGQLKVGTMPINCQTGNTYGNMTEDGQYLTIWSRKTKGFNVYKISYAEEQD